MPTTRQWVLYGGIGAGGLAIAAFMYERNKKNKAATAAATTASQQASGAYAYGYGAYGYGQLTYQPEVYGYGLGYYGYGLSYPYGSAGGTGTVPVAAATTNAMWSQAAVSQLTSQGQYDAGAVQAALGVYLTGGTLSGEQQAIVQSAIAVEGYPPQNGPDGYPPAMHSATVNAPPPTPGPTGQTTVQVPYVVGQRLDVAIKNIENAGLKEHTSTLAAYGFPSRWKVAGQNPAGGQVAKGSTVTCSAVKA